MGDHRLPKMVMSKELENTRQRGPGARRTDGLRDSGSSGVWHHGGLEYCHTRPRGLVRHIMRRGLQVYGREGEGRG